MEDLSIALMDNSWKLPLSADQTFYRHIEGYCKTAKIKTNHLARHLNRILKLKQGEFYYDGLSAGDPS